MRRFIVKIILALIPKRKWRQYLQSEFDFFDLNTDKIYNKQYGKIYVPIYSRYHKMYNKEPEIYNKDGSLIRTFFLRDKCFSASNPQVSKYFIFDKYNFELPVHFYTHNCMKQTLKRKGTFLAEKMFGLLCESKEILPNDYLIFDRHPGLNKDFDLIFTYDEDILNKYDNAREFCQCANISLGDNITDDELNACLTKNKNISIISSDKKSCELHKLRFEWATHFEKDDKVDTFGTFNGGKYVRAIDTLKNYRYSIVVENAILPFWFTEKILNCFATYTVPIYVGHSNILKRFNSDGIIFVPEKDFDHIDEIIKQCSAQDYEQRLPAIMDNYKRVQQYKNSYDLLWEKYLKDILN